MSNNLVRYLTYLCRCSHFPVHSSFHRWHSLKNFTMGVIQSRFVISRLQGESVLRLSNVEPIIVSESTGIVFDAEYRSTTRAFCHCFGGSFTMMNGLSCHVIMFNCRSRRSSERCSTPHPGFTFRRSWLVNPFSKVVMPHSNLTVEAPSTHGRKSCL